MFLISLVPTWNLLWEGVYGMLRQHQEFVFQERGSEHNVPHAILLAHLVFVGCICGVIFNDAIEETMCPWSRTGKEGSRVEFKTKPLIDQYGVDVVQITMVIAGRDEARTSQG